MQLAKLRGGPASVNRELCSSRPHRPENRVGMNRGTIQSGKPRIPLVKCEGEIRPGQHHGIDAGFFHEVFSGVKKHLTLRLGDGPGATSGVF